MGKSAKGVLIGKLDLDDYAWSQSGIYEVPETARGIKLDFEDGHRDRQIGDSSIGLDLSALRKGLKISIPINAHYAVVSENNERRMQSPDKPLMRVSYLNSEKRVIDFSEQIFDNIFGADYLSGFIGGMMEIYAGIKPYASGNFPKQ